MAKKKVLPFSKELTSSMKFDLIHKLNLCEKETTCYTYCYRCGASCITDHYKIASKKKQYCEVCKLAYGLK